MEKLLIQKRNKMEWNHQISFKGNHKVIKFYIRKILKEKVFKVVLRAKFWIITKPKHLQYHYRKETKISWLWRHNKDRKLKNMIVFFWKIKFVFNLQRGNLRSLFWRLSKESLNLWTKHPKKWKEISLNRNRNRLTKQTDRLI